MDFATRQDKTHTYADAAVAIGLTVLGIVALPGVAFEAAVVGIGYGIRMAMGGDE